MISLFLPFNLITSLADDRPTERH